MVYATAEDVAAGFRTLTAEEITRCNALLEEAAVLVDAYAAAGPADAKRVVSCRMVRRVLGSGEDAALLLPMGATQGSASALGYTQSWTMGTGASGELYLSKTDKRLLGIGSRIGAKSPLEGMCDAAGD